MNEFSSEESIRAPRAASRRSRRRLIGTLALVVSLGISTYTYAIFVWFVEIIIICTVGPAPLPTSVTGFFQLDPATGEVTYSMTLDPLGGGDTVASASVVAGADTDLCDSSGAATVAVLDPTLAGTYTIPASEQTAMITGEHIVIIITTQGRIIWIRITKIPPPAIPAASQWGFACMGLLILTTGTYFFYRRRSTATG